MRAMVFDHYGEPDVMSLRDVAVPEPQDGEVLIRVGYAGVNPSDSKARSGQSARGGYRLSRSRFSIRHRHGCRRYRGANGVKCHRIQARRSRRHVERGGREDVGQLCGIHSCSGKECRPNAKKPEFRASGRCPGCLADRLSVSLSCEKGGLIPGQKVLIHGAAGGVGSFAVQFAKCGGLLVAATCGTANVEYVRSLGAERVIDYKTEDVCQAVRDWSAGGVDVVLDAVGPATLPKALDMLRPGGRLVNILTVTADGDIEHDRKEAERRGFRKILTLSFERAQESMREITDLIDAGLVKVPPIDVLRLEDAAQAHRMIETGHVRGKLVLKVADLGD